MSSGEQMRVRPPLLTAESAQFDWITPVLGVGGRLNAAWAPDLIRRNDIAAIVDLRVEACDDRAQLARCGAAFLHLPTADHCAVSQAMLDEGVAFARKRMGAGRRVLIHCEHGIGRSATLALCVLAADGMTPMDALAQMKDARPCISPSPAQYEAWSEWLSRRGMGAPTFPEFCTIAYRHLKG